LVNYVNEQQTNWPRFVHSVCYAFNTSVNSTTGFSPFELLYGHSPVLIAELGLEKIAPPGTDYAKDLYKTINKLRERAYVNVLKAQAGMRRQYNKKRKAPRIYRTGDLVLLHYRKTVERLSPKLTFHARGVYRILRKIPERNNYVLQLVNKRKGIADRQLTVNVDQIVPYVMPCY